MNICNTSILLFYNIIQSFEKNSKRYELNISEDRFPFIIEKGGNLCLLSLNL